MEDANGTGLAGIEYFEISGPLTAAEGPITRRNTHRVEFAELDEALLKLL
jgi:hypothetical protein